METRASQQRAKGGPRRATVPPAYVASRRVAHAVLLGSNRYKASSFTDVNFKRKQAARKPSYEGKQLIFYYFIASSSFYVFYLPRRDARR